MVQIIRERGNYHEEQSFISIDSKNTGKGRVILAMKNCLRMTEGSISQKIIFFAIPLFLGNLFQQLYNTADSLIVGNFLGSNALAAVSSSGNLIFLMVGFINGIAMGAGVVIARYYGAKKRDCLQKAIHTTVAFGLVAGAALTVLGMLLAPIDPAKYVRKYTIDSGSTSAGVPINTRIFGARNIPRTVSKAPDTSPNATVVWIAFCRKSLFLAP